MTDDLHRYGDTYWHRMHQLPGVALCVAHGCELLVGKVNVRATTTMGPPLEAKGQKIPSRLRSKAVNFEIAECSRAALYGELPIQNWNLHYRDQAAQLNYAKVGGESLGISSPAICWRSTVSHIYKHSAWTTPQVHAELGHSICSEHHFRILRRSSTSY